MLRAYITGKHANKISSFWAFKIASFLAPKAVSCFAWVATARASFGGIALGKLIPTIINDEEPFSPRPVLAFWVAPCLPSL